MEEKLLKYWRNCLVDADRRRIEPGLDCVRQKSWHCYIDRVCDEDTVSLFDAAKKRKGQEECEKIKVQIAPCFVLPEYTDGHTAQAQWVYPFWIPAVLLQDGTLEMREREEERLPVFIREVLSPNARNDVEISTLDRVDELLSGFHTDCGDWKSYWQEAEYLFEQATGKKYRDLNLADEPEIVVQLAVDRGMAANVIRLYDYILEGKVECRLLDVLTKRQPEKILPSPDPLAVYGNRMHLGQLKCDFPLSVSQRETLAMYTEPGGSEIFAVNGPPGTGKTTFLQTVVANHLVNLVVEHPDDPQIIIACSANNQAITNILKGFVTETEDLLSERWLPGLDTLGLYLSSKKSGDYKKMESVWGNGFPEEYEKKEKSEEYREFFLARFNSYFGTGEKDTEVCKRILYEKILSLKKQIQEFLILGIRLDEVKTLTDVDESMFAGREVDYASEQLKGIERRISELIQAEQAFRKLGLRDKLLPFLSRSKRRNKEVVAQVMDKVGDWLLPGKEYADCKKLAACLAQLKKDMFRYKELLSEWCINDCFKAAYNKVLGSGDEYKGLSVAADMSVRLDLSLRYQIFWYTVHYREADYLKRLEERPEGYERKRTEYTERLKRLACIMPVFISTFHSLPRYLNCAEKGDNTSPLFQVIDLLIVDEAGQVTPELAAPAFALAKKAVLVGDVFQIEPVWSVSDVYSEINLVKNEVVRREDEEQIRFLEVQGFTSSSGSIMKLAQKSCSFRVGKERGAFLAEHRRCLNLIIRYCNDYVYDGKLKLKVGEHSKYHTGLPPKGYVHVNGVSEAGKTGSRFNRAEAAAIVTWLGLKREELEKVYQKPIAEIVAVITPFKAQELKIRSLLREVPDAEEYKEMVIGTVHALQGAECPVVLFSSVNSLEDRSYFMERDNKYNLLNVAVSRAKHCFLVFGNMNIFDPGENTPAGNLAKWLFDSPENELSGDFIYNQKQPLGVYAPTERISTLEGHRRLLKRAFETARRRLVIVSPFISVHAIEQDGIVKLIRACKAKGTEVFVYTDKYLDMDFKKECLREHAKQGRKCLVSSGAELIVLDGIHNKSVAVDDKVLVEGSFNWLAAPREPSRTRYEVSVMMSDVTTPGHIRNLICELNRIHSADKKPVLNPDLKTEEEAAEPLSDSESRSQEIGDGWGSLDKAQFKLEMMPEAAAFFGQKYFNTLTPAEEEQLKHTVRNWGIGKKDHLTDQLIEIRKLYPRHMERWSDAERDLFGYLLQKTNSLELLVACLQRKPSALVSKVNEWIVNSSLYSCGKK